MAPTLGTSPAQRKRSGVGESHGESGGGCGSGGHLARAGPDNALRRRRGPVRPAAWALLVIALAAAAAHADAANTPGERDDGEESRVGRVQQMEQELLEATEEEESARPQRGAGGLPSVHVVTALYQKPEGLNREVCNAVGSMLLMGYNVTVLTWDWARKKLPVTTANIESGKAALLHTFKVVLYRVWMRSQVAKEQREREQGKVGPRELQLLVDGSDVIFMRRPEELAASLVELMNDTHPIIASAQKTCFPRKFVGIKRCRSAPLSPYEDGFMAAFMRQNSTPFDTWSGGKDPAPRYLNSGAVAGPAADLLKVLESATNEELHGFSDQAIFAVRYLTPWEGSWGIQLDFAGALAHTVYRGEEDVEVIPGSDPLTMRNVITGALPAVIHFNGDSKLTEHEWEISKYVTAKIQRALNGQLRLPGRLFHGSGADMSLSEWCGDSR